MACGSFACAVTLPANLKFTGVTATTMSTEVVLTTVRAT